MSKLSFGIINIPVIETYPCLQIKSNYFCNQNFIGMTDLKIRQFVNEELMHYPEATLIDLYKNYFQDAFGPGHLIPDSASTGEYLNLELSQPHWTDTLLWQPLGVNHDFYRINLLLLKNKAIPHDVFLAGMVKSAQLAGKPDIENWINEWNVVLQKIKQLKLNLPTIKSDEEMIAHTLSKGIVMMHHSKRYEETYHPHYRIIHRSIFKLWYKKYLLECISMQC